MNKSRDPAEWDSTRDMSAPPSATTPSATTPSAPSYVLRLVSPEPASAAERALSDVGYNGAPPGADIDEGEESEVPSSPETVLVTPPSSPPNATPHRLRGGKEDTTDDIYEYETERATTDKEFSGHATPLHLPTNSPPITEFVYRRYGYHARMGIKQTFKPSNIRPPEFSLHIDTGSGISWVLGANYGELLDSQTGTVGPRPADWARHPVREKLFHHPYNPLSIPNSVPKQTVSYADGAALVVVQPDRHMKCFLESYAWAEQRWDAPVELDYPFAIAVATNKHLDSDRTAWSGSLALGLSSKQEGFPRHKDKNHPSFLRAVQGSVLGPWRPEPSGSIMYFGLRVIPPMIPLIEHTLYESWVAFNRWPCAKFPEFSAEISVTGNSDWRRRTKWCGRVVKIELFDRVPQAGSIMGHYAEPINIELPTPTKTDEKAESTPEPDPDETKVKGFPVVFDTGASVSWLPGAVVSQIARHYRRSPLRANDLPDTASSATGVLDAQSTAASALRGGSTSTKPMPEGDESQTGNDTPVTLKSPFVVDPRNYVPFHEVAITYLGMDEISLVTVRVEAEHFLYARNPEQMRRHEGLIFPREPGQHATFGLNWFHAHWVAMYQPTVGVPHMRLAPQTHGAKNMKLIVLPPKNGEVR